MVHWLYHTKEVFIMSDGFKAWGSILLILGLIMAAVSLYMGDKANVICGLSGVAVGISFFINAAFCKILEDTRDTLKRIEDFMKNENKTE